VGAYRLREKNAIGMVKCGGINVIILKNLSMISERILHRSIYTEAGDDSNVMTLLILDSVRSGRTDCDASEIYLPMVNFGLYPEIIVRVANRALAPVRLVDRLSQRYRSGHPELAFRRLRERNRGVEPLRLLMTQVMTRDHVAGSGRAVAEVVVMLAGMVRWRGGRVERVVTVAGGAGVRVGWHWHITYSISTG
jgi:hypothetical protein